METVLSVVVRPLFLVLLLVSASFLAYFLAKLIPEGRIKEFLLRKHEIVPSRPSSPAVQWTCGIILALIAILIIFKPLSLLR